MRTKKILSVLLAAFMLFGVIGIVGAVAYEDVDAVVEEVIPFEGMTRAEARAAAEAAEAAELAVAGEIVAFAASIDAALATQAANIGLQSTAVWPQDSLSVVRRADLLNSWESMVFEWVGFTGYGAQRDAGVATFEWRLNRQVTHICACANANPPRECLDCVTCSHCVCTTACRCTLKNLWETDVIVSANEASAMSREGLRIFRQSTSTSERLVIYQDPDNKWFGNLEVTIGVRARPTATGTPTETRYPVEGFIRSTPTRALLLDESAFVRVINRANAILDQSGRYNEAYIRNLRNARTAAVNARSLDINIADNRLAIQAAQTLLQGVIDRAGDNFSFNIGWEWLDNLLDPGLPRIVYFIEDIFNSIQPIIDPIIALFTGFFGIFGSIIPLITLLFGLFF